MASNNDKKKRTVSKPMIINAAASLAKKLKQENKLRKNMRSHFKGFAKETFSHYTKYGHVPSNISSHRNDVEKILNDHYLDTSSQFRNTIRDKIGAMKNNENIDKRLSSVIAHRAQAQSHESANMISETTRDHVDKSIKDALAVAAAAGIILSNKDVAEQAGNDFYDKSIGRSETIAITETQIAAETTKDDEQDVLDDMDSETEYGEKFRDLSKTKTWVAILDERTREAHAEADGQEVQINEPYEVGGEELMFPGDDSLGASDENIINCRCSSEHEFGEEE